MKGIRILIISATSFFTSCTLLSFSCFADNPILTMIFKFLCSKITSSNNQHLLQTSNHLFINDKSSRDALKIINFIEKYHIAFALSKTFTIPITSLSQLSSFLLNYISRNVYSLIHNHQKLT